MASADPVRILATVMVILGRPSQQELNYNDVHAARIASGMEILRLIASNPQNGYFGSLATLVTVAHNAFLPAHDGEPGIPRIIPFSGAGAMEGVPAKPSEIDSYRMAPSGGKLIYSGGSDGVAVAHNAADANGMPSPVSARYSIVDKVFKFTGFSAQIPLIQLSRSMADTAVPENYEPTLVKMIIPRVLTPGSKLFALAQSYAAAAEEDLTMIAGGSMNVPPVPSIELAQKAGVV